MVCFRPIPTRALRLYFQLFSILWPHTQPARSVVESFSPALPSKQGAVRISKFGAAYRQFPHRYTPRLLETGPNVPRIYYDLASSLYAGGRSVPAAGRYALRVFADALSLGIPAAAPAALSETRPHIIRLSKTALL